MLTQFNINNVKVPVSGGEIDVNSTDFGKILTAFLPYLFSLAGILLLIYMITGGLQMMFAKGDPKALQSAQGKITTALIGFVVVIMAYFIVSLLGRMFGIDQFHQIFGGRTRWIK